MRNIKIYLFMWAEKSDSDVLKEIGDKVKKYRLQKNITQSSLAGYAYVSVTVIQRLERGLPVSTLNLVAVLRELKILDKLETAFPDIPISPIVLMKLKGKERKRASNLQD